MTEDTASWSAARLGKLVDHEAPDAPTARFAPPHGHVATGAVDRRTGLGSLNLLVRPDVDGVIARDKEVGAREVERRNAIRCHLADEERVHRVGPQVRLAREQKAHVARNQTKRLRRVALEPRLAVLREGRVDRGAIGRGINDRSAAARRDRERDKESAGYGLHMPPGRSELLMSREIFHDPSSCRSHTVRYFPLSTMSAPVPVLGCSVHTYVPRSTAYQPVMMTSWVASRAAGTENWARKPLKP